MIWTFHFNLNEAIVRKGGKSLVRCSPLKLNERCEEGCWRTSIFVSISRFIYSCTSWKLMPNDLGQPGQERGNSQECGWNNASRAFKPVPYFRLNKVISPPCFRANTDNDRIVSKDAFSIFYLKPDQILLVKG